MIQLLRVVFLFFSIMCFCFAESLVVQNETVDTVGKIEYYKLDRNGVSFNSLGDQFLYKDSVRVKLFFRHAVRSDFEGEKEFKVSISINKKNPYTLTYKKEISEKQKNSKKGWGWTKAGVWFVDLHVKDFRELLVKKEKGNNIIVRAYVTKIYDRHVNKYNDLRTIDGFKRTKIESQQGDKIKTSYYYRLSNSKRPHHFEVVGPAAFRVLTRLENPSEKSNENNYSIFIKEDGVDIGTYLFSTKLSQESKVSSTRASVGKWRSCFVNVPSGRHYYSISKGDVSDNTVYIRLKEYEAKK